MKIQIDIKQYTLNNMEQVIYETSTIKLVRLESGQVVKIDKPQ